MCASLYTYPNRELDVDSTISMKEREFDILHREALKVGRLAGFGCQPAKTTKAMAAVTLGNSAFAKWLIKNNFAVKTDAKRIQIMIGAYDRSKEKTMAHAVAMAAYFSSKGTPATAGIVS